MARSRPKRTKCTRVFGRQIFPKVLWQSQKLGNGKKVFGRVFLFFAVCRRPLEIDASAENLAKMLGRGKSVILAELASFRRRTPAARERAAREAKLKKFREPKFSSGFWRNLKTFFGKKLKRISKKLSPFSKKARRWLKFLKKNLVAKNSTKSQKTSCGDGNFFAEICTKKTHQNQFWNQILKRLSAGCADKNKTPIESDAPKICSFKKKFDKRKSNPKMTWLFCKAYLSRKIWPKMKIR